MAKRFRGVYNFAVTPMKDDGSQISEAGLRDYLDYQISCGVHGVCIFGSTGAIGSFNAEERISTVKAAVKHVNGRIPVIAGTGSMSTDEAVRLSKAAQDDGADGVLVVPITYWPLTDDELYEHYKTIAGSVKIPLVIYNNPWVTGVDMKPALLVRMGEIDNIRYVKESSGNLARITAIRTLSKDKMTVFDGWEPTTLQSFMAGSDGWFSGGSNVCPKLCVELFNLAVEKKDVLAARSLFDRMYPLMDFIATRSHVRVAHTALKLQGHRVGPPRRPLAMLGAADTAELSRILESLDLLKASKAA